MVHYIIIIILIKNTGLYSNFIYLKCSLPSYSLFLFKTNGDGLLGYNNNLTLNCLRIAVYSAMKPVSVITESE